MPWLFQANPKYSRIVEAIADRPQIHWLVTRYQNEIRLGDSVLIWVAGKRAGIYATAEVMEPPHFLDEPPDLDIWTMPIRARGRFYASVTFTQKFVDAPLLKSDLRHHSVLRSLTVIHAPHNTNFRITAEQWEILKGKR